MFCFAIHIYTTQLKGDTLHTKQGDKMGFYNLPLLLYYLLKMKNILKTTTAQFRKCQATIATFQCENEKHEKDYGNFTIFYSYTCPKIIEFPNGATYQFTFENSRKAGAITSSMTTSKQCNKWLGSNHHDLPKFNLGEFENLYFDTRLENYY